MPSTMRIFRVALTIAAMSILPGCTKSLSEQASHQHAIVQAMEDFCQTIPYVMFSPPPPTCPEDHHGVSVQAGNIYGDRFVLSLDRTRVSPHVLDGPIIGVMIGSGSGAANFWDTPGLPPASIKGRYGKWTSSDFCPALLSYPSLLPLSRRAITGPHLPFLQAHFRHNHIHLLITEHFDANDEGLDVTVRSFDDFVVSDRLRAYLQRLRGCWRPL